MSGSTLRPQRRNGSFYECAHYATGYNDKNFVTEIVAKGKAIEDAVITAEAEVVRIVNEKIGM